MMKRTGAGAPFTAGKTATRGPKVLVAAFAALAVLLATTTHAEAAGVTTHAWMGMDAVDLVGNPQLKALLKANLGQVEGGAQYPDSGYLNRTLGVPGGDYGEEAHWQRFYDAYVQQIRNNPNCGDLTDPNGPCAPEIAHLMGMAAHGMGDEVWDWLFEPNAPDHGEQYLPPELSLFVSEGGIEFQMDMIAIYYFGRSTSPDTPPVPNEADLQAAFAAVGRTDITISGLQTGKMGMGVLRQGEGSLAPQHAPLVAAAMPWTSANMVNAPGGVKFAARAIAGEYESLWGQLLGSQPPTKVSVTYPADGQTTIPATGWERSFEPGSYHDRGGARNRIAAALTYSRPYVPDATDPNTHVPQELPAGAMTLTNTSNNQVVPTQSGYPKSVPYGADSGEHVVDIQPLGDLDPCTTYRVDITESLLDAKGTSVVPMSWSFTTEGCANDTTTVSQTLPQPATSTSAAPSTTAAPNVNPTTTATPGGSEAGSGSGNRSASPVVAVPRFTG